MQYPALKSIEKKGKFMLAVCWATLAVLGITPGDRIVSVSTPRVTARNTFHP